MMNKCFTVNSPQALLARLMSVQLALLLSGSLLFLLFTSLPNSLAFLFGALVCLAATVALGVVALRPVKFGQERMYVKIMARVQIMRLFVCALLLALIIGWLKFSPVYVMLGFVSTQAMSWFFVFFYRSKKRYYYS